jgi:hypothetical protein
MAKRGRKRAAPKVKEEEEGASKSQAEPSKKIKGRPSRQAEPKPKPEPEYFDDKTNLVSCFTYYFSICVVKTARKPCSFVKVILLPTGF